MARFPKRPEKQGKECEKLENLCRGICAMTAPQADGIEVD